MGHAVQDTLFVNISASSLIWSDDGVVVAHSLSYNNVTTDTHEWGTSGGFVGTGLESDIIREFPDTASEPLLILTFPATPILEPGDTWFVSVQKVCIHVRMNTVVHNIRRTCS